MAATKFVLRRLVLVRHGETEGESSIRYHGSNDVALSEDGRRQMRRVGRVLAQQAFDALYTSTLRRTRESATLIAPHLPPTPISAFDEINFGAWEGLTADEIAARDPDLFRSWRSDPATFHYPDGDSVVAFRERVARAWQAMLPAAPERVLMVAHKGVIATILNQLLAPPPGSVSPAIDLASIHLIVRDADVWCARLANFTRHLQDDFDGQAICD